MIAFYRLLILVLFIAFWWGVSLVVGVNFLPDPGRTLQAAIKMAQDGKIFEAFLETLEVYAAGYAIAIVIGIPTGLLLGGFRTFGRAMEVYVNAFTATPRVAFIPLIIVFLGLGFRAKIAIVYLGAVMPIVINTYAGVLNADGELVEMARSVGASRRQIFTKILLPGALPFIVVGLRLGATIGLINTVVAELYTAVRGLGGMLSFYGNTFQMAPYFVVVVILAFLGMGLTQVLRLVEGRIDRWRYDGG